VRQYGGVPLERSTDQLNLVVIGAEVFPLVDCDDLLDDATREAAATGRAEIITETQFWQRLGFVESEDDAHRLYTPAMLADLLGIGVSIIRRWHRRGLIVPERVVHRLPYFNFQEIATARRLAQLVAAGASPAAIERKLEELARHVPDVERPLAQLSVIVQGKQILLRQGEGLIEPGGQRRIDFDALERGEADTDSQATGDQTEGTAVVSLSNYLAQPQLASPSELLEFAADLEDEGQLDEAVAMYRTAMASGGPSAEICFHLAELLYRQGDVAGARERYYMAIELDEDYVEARANLGCVLLESGDLEMAIAAFQGALSYHADYPDVHYHLARTLDELGRFEESESHWRSFLALAPESPWAEEAQQRLADQLNEFLEESDVLL